MHNFYSSSENIMKKEFRSPAEDNDDDDYENVSEATLKPAVPVRARKSDFPDKVEDLKLTCFNQHVVSSGNTSRGFNQHAASSENAVIVTLPGPSFEPPRLGLDFSSPAVNSAFRGLSDEPQKEKSLKPGWKSLVSAVLFIFIFLVLISIIGIIFLYYSKISSELEDIKLDVSAQQESNRNERIIQANELKGVIQTFNSQISSQLEDIKLNVSAQQESNRNERIVQANELKEIKQTFSNENNNFRTLVQSLKRHVGLCTVCQPSWVLVGNTCYYLSQIPENWEDSKKKCIKQDSSLLILKSKNELDPLVPLTGSKRFWMGLRLDNNNQWKWLNGKPLEFTSWFPNEPNNYQDREHCGEMLKGQWNDLDCDTKIDYICEKLPSC